MDDGTLPAIIVLIFDLHFIYSNDFVFRTMIGESVMKALCSIGSHTSL